MIESRNIASATCCIVLEQRMTSEENFNMGAVPAGECYFRVGKVKYSPRCIVVRLDRETWIIELWPEE